MVCDHCIIYLANVYLTICSSRLLWYSGRSCLYPVWTEIVVCCLMAQLNQFQLQFIFGFQSLDKYCSAFTYHASNCYSRWLEFFPRLLRVVSSAGTLQFFSWKWNIDHNEGSVCQTFRFWERSFFEATFPKLKLKNRETYLTNKWRL